MGRIDESKIIYPVFLVLSIVFSIVPILGCIDVMCVNSYTSFVELLDAWYLPFFYFGRIALSNLDYMNFAFLKLIVSLITSLNIANIIMLLLFAYLFCAKKETYMKKRKRGWQSISFIYVLGYILSACIFIFGFSLTSVNTIIFLFKMAGLVLFVCHCMILIIAILFLYIEWRLLYAGN